MGSYPTELNGSANGLANGLPQIIDIRSDTAYISLKQGILSGLHPADGGEKTLPTLLLYDDKGLRLFEEITYLEQYYLTNQEVRGNDKVLFETSLCQSQTMIPYMLMWNRSKSCKRMLNALRRSTFQTEL